MTDVEAVLRRLETDAAFRAALAEDPVGALASYDTSAEDLARIGARLAELGDGPPKDGEVRGFLDVFGAEEGGTTS